MEIFVNSQLQNEHHFSATFKNIFKSHNVWMLDSLEDLHLSLHTAPVQAKTAACNLPNLQEFACPKVPRGPLPNLANLAKMPTVQGKDRIHKKHQAWHASKMLCPVKMIYFFFVKVKTNSLPRHLGQAWSPYPHSLLLLSRWSLQKSINSSSSFRKTLNNCSATQVAWGNFFP